MVMLMVFRRVWMEGMVPHPSLSQRGSPESVPTPPTTSHLPFPQPQKLRSEFQNVGTESFFAED